MKAEGGFSFRLNGKTYATDRCVCLYRAIDADEMVTRILLLTRDGRFAHLGRVVGATGMRVADDWSGDRAMRFLIQHGEGDLVDEFRDIFRKRQSPAQPVRDRKTAAAPQGRAAEPYLFPLS